jgi:hypothetical protein
MKTKVYVAKTLFRGVVVGKEDVDFVGIPGGQNYQSKHDYSSEKNFIVVHDGKSMKIKNWHKAEAFRKFDDFNGRGNYTLAYFAWKPEQEPERVNTNHALSKMAERPEWEDLRRQLHS